MGMIPFVERFPELAARETRTATIPLGHDLPEGEYGFAELYCDDPGCDCRRVLIDVLRPETGWSKIWATISYGWESVDFYRQWGVEDSDPIQITGPYLDPLNPQTRYSPALLNLFRSVVLSPEYIARLERHYRIFRGSVDGEHKQRNSEETNRTVNRRKHLRDPRRRSRHSR